MRQKKNLFVFLFAFLLFAFLSIHPGLAYAGTVLRTGMSGSTVSQLQKDLKALGFMSVNPTGYFGNATKSAVISFQRRYGLQADGIAGPQTLLQVDRLLRRTPATSRGVPPQNNGIQLLPWFGKVNSIFGIGTAATVTDIDTGLKFTVKRTFGYNHADVEPLTSKDTAILKKIAGGSWNWTRRAVIVEVKGIRIAASITAMPHAGRDDMPVNITVNSRSGGYGRGENLDSVKNNGMDGHFDIHFYGSKTHTTNRVDTQHQEMVKKAYNSGL